MAISVEEASQVFLLPYQLPTCVHSGLCFLLSGAHRSQEDVGCDGEAYCMSMAAKWQVYKNIYTAIYLHGMGHVQTPSGSCFLLQRHLAKFYCSLPLPALLPPLLEARVQETLVPEEWAAVSFYSMAA